MNLQSIVRFVDTKGQFIGMGTIMSHRCVVTLGYIVQGALGLSEGDDSIPSDPVSFQMPFSSGQAMISSRVIGWTPTSLGEESHTPLLFWRYLQKAKTFYHPLYLLARVIQTFIPTDDSGC
jgi:hypothetical protein